MRTGLVVCLTLAFVGSVVVYGGSSTINNSKCVTMMCGSASAACHEGGCSHCSGIDSFIKSCAVWRNSSCPFSGSLRACGQRFSGSCVGDPLVGFPEDNDPPFKSCEGLTLVGACTVPEC